MNWRAGWKRQFHRLIDPVVKLENPEDFNKAQLLAALLLPYALAIAALFVLGRFLGPGTSELALGNDARSTISHLLCTVAYFVAYYYCRRGRHFGASFVIPIGSLVSICFLNIAVPSDTTVYVTIPFLVSSYAILGFFANRTILVLYFLFTVVAQALMYSMAGGQVTLNAVLTSFFSNLCAAVVIYFGSLIQEFQAKRLNIQRNVLYQTDKWAHLGQLSGSVAHEINSPLTVLLARVSQLSKALAQGGKTQEEMLRMSGDVEAMSLRITRVVQSMRRLTHESGSNPMEVVRLESIIQDALQILSLDVEKAGISVEIDVSLNQEAFCRPSQMSQVFLNLISNSVYAINELAGEKWIRIKSTVDGDFLQITVTDGGLGIPEETHSKLIHSYFTTKPTGKGTGLGLMISSRILQEHGGELRYNSATRNTQFVIRMPVNSVVTDVAA